MHNSIEWKGCHSLFKNGYEKTLIFESLPFVSGVQNSTVIIVSPLHSINTEQLQHYGQNSLSVSPDVIKGLSKECGTKETDRTCTCVNCKFELSSYWYVIGHSEHFLKKKLFETFKLASKRYPYCYRWISLHREMGDWLHENLKIEICVSKGTCLGFNWNWNCHNKNDQNNKRHNGSEKCEGCEDFNCEK